MTTKIKNSVYYYRAPVKDPNKESLYKILSDEDCEDFYTYIDWLDLSKKPNIIVLPLSNHYYYHPEEFAQTETLINLKCLNQIRDLGSFLGKIHKNLSEECFFTGCFINGKNENRQVKGNKSGKSLFNSKNSVKWTKFLKKFKQIFYSFNTTKLRKEYVRSILDDIGFLVLDMTELNGKTYFCAKKQSIFE